MVALPLERAPYERPLLGSLVIFRIRNSVRDNDLLRGRRRGGCALRHLVLRCSRACLCDSVSGSHLGLATLFLWLDGIGCCVAVGCLFLDGFCLAAQQDGDGGYARDPELCAR